MRHFSVPSMVEIRQPVTGQAITPTPCDAREERERPLMFDLGIADLMLLGPADQELYLVEFRCRCAVVVARGQVIRRTRGFRLVCEHVSVGC